MPWFDTGWDSLGYDKGDVQFYGVDYTLFGTLPDAMPPECAAAMRTAGAAHRVAYHAKDIEWLMLSVDRASQTITPAPRNLDGATDTSKNGCTEHGFWEALKEPRIIRGPKNNVQQGHIFDTVMGGQSILVIYTTLAPCLSCCNALVGLAWLQDMNIIIRAQQDYEFAGARRKQDLTVMIPRKNAITSMANPASADRRVWVLHDGSLDFSNANGDRYKGSVRPAVNRCSPHMTPGGPACGSLNVEEYSVDFGAPKCDSCNADVINHRAGSGLPWQLPVRLAKTYTPAEL